MVRTYASFEWDLQIPEESEPPYAADEAEKFVEALRVAGLDVSPPEDGQYAWNIFCQLSHLQMDCQLGLVMDRKWLLACDPWRGLVDWLLRRRWENEQKQFVSIIDAVLRSDTRISDLQWHTRKEWSAPTQTEL